MGRMVEYIEKFYMDDTGKIYHEGRTGEVIRCKDCKRFNKFIGYCDVWCAYRKDDGYCDRAERKDE